MRVEDAGVGPARRIVGRDGPHPLDEFERVIAINLTGTFNMLRLAAADMQTLEPLADGERGVIVSTASVAALLFQVIARQAPSSAAARSDAGHSSPCWPVLCRPRSTITGCGRNSAGRRV